MKAVDRQPKAHFHFNVLASERFCHFTTLVIIDASDMFLREITAFDELFSGDIRRITVGIGNHRYLL